MDKAIINILGTKYVLKKKNFSEDDSFKQRGINGYCDKHMSEIVICNMNTYPGYEYSSSEKCKRVESATLRHEIIHAFLHESGLMESTGQPSEGWSQNEEMVDWIALQFPKMLIAFQEVECI